MRRRISRRRAMSAAVAGVIPAPAKSRTPSKPSAALPPDALLKMFGQPLFDRCLSDEKFRREFTEQCYRVFGRRPMAEMTWRLIVDAFPEVAQRRVVARIIKRNLGI